MTSTNTFTVTAGYSGGAERRGPVTIGQANMIRCILRDDPVHINIHDVWPVPAGTRLESVVEALRTLVLRHEALRTTFALGPDGLHSEQVVAAEGEFTLTVVDHQVLPEDSWRYAESVARQARHGRFRLDREFPLRLTVITAAGAPTYTVLAASHAVADAGAIAVLREEWLALLAGRELPPLTALTPIELAAAEATPEGQRKSQSSLRHWEQIIRTGPQAVFAEPGAEGVEGKHPQLTLRSRRAALALARAARRTGSPPATVLLTAWCTLIGHRAGQTSCVVAVPTSNRFQAGLARTVGTLSQDALLRLDLAVPSFDALLRKAWGAALNAYRHSTFDSVRLWEMIDRTTFERGSSFARDVVFNDVSALPATLVSTADWDRAEPELELSWGPDQVLPTRVLAFAYQHDPLLHLSIWADPALFTREEAENFLLGLVRLLEAVGTVDVPFDSLTGLTGVRPAERGADWTGVDGCWVSPPAVARALGTALGGLPVHVTADDPVGPDGGPGLTAYIAAGDTVLTPAGAHTALMKALPGRPGVLAPHRYVIVQDPPAGAGTWAQQQVLVEGNGRERPVGHDD
ncbi:condensation domain-containing protein [Kitasatospora sp. NPDC002040]|uniref:condensation domain-containing protein n=1 Tax=Kitasatospora sp. NPDC002040 TaxID=3154661 RepID=UPI0033169E16